MKKTIIFNIFTNLINNSFLKELFIKLINLMNQVGVGPYEVGDTLVVTCEVSGGWKPTQTNKPKSINKITRKKTVKND